MARHHVGSKARHGSFRSSRPMSVETTSLDCPRLLAHERLWRGTPCCAPAFCTPLHTIMHRRFQYRSSFEDFLDHKERHLPRTPRTFCAIVKMPQVATL